MGDNLITTDQVLFLMMGIIFGASAIGMMMLIFLKNRNGLIVGLNLRIDESNKELDKIRLEYSEEVLKSRNLDIENKKIPNLEKNLEIEKETSKEFEIQLKQLESKFESIVDAEEEKKEFYLNQKKKYL